jgi:hypothetical protein
MAKNNAKAVVEDLEGRIALLQESIRNANTTLPVLHSELVTARALAAVEAQKAQELEFGRLRSELQKVLAGLDESGWNPASERRVAEILSAFRQARRSGQSAEALRLYCEKLRNPTGGRAPKRSWSALLDWVQQPKEAA